jgi:hypothetical protein
MALLMQIPADVRMIREKRYREVQANAHGTDTITRRPLFSDFFGSLDQWRSVSSFKGDVRTFIDSGCSRELTARIPEEIIERIEFFAAQDRRSEIDWPTLRKRPKIVSPSLPPPFKACPFLDRLPTEIRVLIYKQVVQLNTTIAKPCCENSNKAEDVAEQKSTARELSNLMTVNSKICKELQRVIYEGRRFAIHVHSGYVGGGVEFVDTGRQPLQYHIGKFDDRFRRFALSDDFGFSSLAQIDVHIFPAKSKNRGDRAHGVLAANAMNAALVYLIKQRIEDGGKVNSLRIFIEAPNERTENEGSEAANTSSLGRKLGTTDPWWNDQTQEPLWTCFHGLSDIQLALQPFMYLHQVHDVTITLPWKFTSHKPTIEFLENLRSRMQSIAPLPIDDEALAAKIHCAHLAMENRVDWKSRIPLLTELEIQAEAECEDGDDAFDDKVSD